MNYFSYTQVKVSISVLKEYCSFKLDLITSTKQTCHEEVETYTSHLLIIKKCLLSVFFFLAMLGLCCSAQAFL